MSGEKRQPKTKEELNALKEEVEKLNKKLRELTEDEMRMVIGGLDIITSFDDPTTTSITFDPLTKITVQDETRLCFESKPCWGMTPEIDCNICSQYSSCRNTLKN